jgi:hypothetical protein
MNVWTVNTHALAPPAVRAHTPTAAAAACAGGGRPDWGRLLGDAALLEALRDLFCYAQLTTQPLDTTGAFDVNGA